jgi:hypothetical protein
MPRFNNGDSDNPDDISWFNDNLYDDGDSKKLDIYRSFDDSSNSSLNSMDLDDQYSIPEEGGAPSAGSSQSHHGSPGPSSVLNNPPSALPPATRDVVLCISPTAGSATFRYTIYLAESESHL